MKHTVKEREWYISRHRHQSLVINIIIYWYCWFEYGFFFCFSHSWVMRLAPNSFFVSRILFFLREYYLNKIKHPLDNTFEQHVYVIELPRMKCFSWFDYGYIVQRLNIIANIYKILLIACGVIVINDEKYENCLKHLAKTVKKKKRRERKKPNCYYHVLWPIIFNKMDDKLSQRKSIYPQKFVDTFIERYFSLRTHIKTNLFFSFTCSYENS